MALAKSRIIRHAPPGVGVARGIASLPPPRYDLPMSYLALKHLHLSCVALTALLFTLRGGLRAWRPLALRARFWRIAPHLIDTVLLVAGVTLAIQARLNPLEHPWLAGKLWLLLVYIALGSVALKRGKTATQRGVAYGLALGVLATMAWLALAKPGG